MLINHVLLDEHWSGVHARSIQVAKELRNRYNIRTKFFVRESIGSFSSVAIDSGFDVIRWKGHLPSRPQRIRQNLRWFTSSVYPGTDLETNLISKFDHDAIVHVDGLRAYGIVRLASLRGYRTVWHLISSLYPMHIARLLVRSIRDDNVKKVLVADMMKQYYFGSGEKTKGIVIHEPFDENNFSPLLVDMSRVHQLKELHQLNPGPVVLTVCNISRVKGLEYLIRAASIVRNVHPRVIILVVGGYAKSQQAYFEWLVTEVEALGLSRTVRFVGPSSEVREWLHLSNIFTLSSVHEGTPIAILEAMAMERPVVATSVGGIPDQINDGITGLLVEPKDPDQLAQKILYLLDNQTVAKEIAKHARHSVLAHHSLEACVKAHASIYASFD